MLKHNLELNMRDLGKLLILILQLLFIAAATYYLFINFGVGTEETKHVSTVIRMGNERFLVDLDTGNVIFVAGKE
jgi:hypothetical protein